MPAAAAIASSRVLTRPQQVLPDPDMLLYSITSIALKPLNIAEIFSVISSAYRVRSLPCRDSQSSTLSKHCASGHGSRPVIWPAWCRSNTPKTSGVESTTPGLTSTSQNSGKPLKGRQSSPMPYIKAGCGAHRQTGTSAPSRNASAADNGGTCHNAASAFIAAAASADPPPIPAPCGKCFSKVSAAKGFVLRASASACAARRTRFSSPAGTFAACGPVTVSVRRSAAVATIRSPRSWANTTRLSSRWYPSALCPVTFSARLILAGANTETAASTRRIFEIPFLTDPIRESTVFRRHGNRFGALFLQNLVQPDFQLSTNSGGILFIGVKR